MLVLVTGGAGFIGSHIVDALLAAGHDVRIADHCTPPPTTASPTTSPTCEWLRDDLREPAPSGAVDGVDAVCHQAAMVGLGVDLADIADYVSPQRPGTAELLRALHARGFDGRIVLASSMVVYGEGRYPAPSTATSPRRRAPPPTSTPGASSRRCPVCERPLEPRSGPGGRAARTPATSTPPPSSIRSISSPHTPARPGRTQSRCATTTSTGRGCRATRPTPGSPASSARASKPARPPLVTEDGDQLRDFVHVRDVAAANLLALESTATGAFNVASGEPRSVGDMARALAPPWTARRPEVTGAWRAGDVRHVFASIDRARTELGYAPSMSFADGMAEFATAPLR